MTSSELSDKGRLLFSAGFVFGVAFTMLIAGIVTATIARRTGRQLLTSDVVITLAAGIFFAAVVGLSLYFLAFPENRVELPIDGFPATADADDDDSPPP